MKYESIFIYTLKLVWGHFKKFFPRLYVFGFFYGYHAGIPFAASILIPLILHRYLGLPHDIAIMIEKVSLTIAPIFPTAFYAKLKEEDRNDECSMDLCFAAWIITIVYAWWFI